MGRVMTDLTTLDCLQEVEMGIKLQRKCLRTVCSGPLAKSSWCYIMMMVLIVALIVVFVLFLPVKKVIERHGPCYDTCPGKWIGFGSKCFYFSEDMRNWTFSRTSCISLEAHLAQFESLEELDFLRTHMGPFNHWIGLHRESQEQPWRWTDNTEYNKIVLTRGEGECGYLSDIGISSARDYTHRKWICSKSNRSTVQCSEILNQGE